MERKITSALIGGHLTQGNGITMKQTWQPNHMMVCCLLWAQPPFLSDVLLCHRIYMIEINFAEVKRILYKGDRGTQDKTDTTFWLELDAVFNHCHVRSYHQFDCHAHCHAHAVTHI